MEAVQLFGVESRRSHQRHIYEVQQALEDVIRSQQIVGSEHEPTPTEYFVVIFKSFSAGGVLDEHLSHLLEILTAVIPHAVKSIVREQFKQLSAILLRIAQAASENSKILRLCLSALGGAMQAQEFSNTLWSSVQSLTTVNAFLGLLDDSRPKLRKTVHSQLSALLKSHKISKCVAVGSYVGDFSLEVLRSCTRSEYKRAIHVLSFMEISLAYLPADATYAVLNASLHLQACGQPMLTAAVFRMIDFFYQSPQLSLSAEQLHRCIELVMGSPPETADMEANTYYCTALASGFVALHRMKCPSLMRMLPAGVRSLVQACESDFLQIHTAAASALKRISSTCFDDEVITEAIDIAQRQQIIAGERGGDFVGAIADAHPLLHILTTLESVFQLRYQNSWVCMMDGIRGFFERIRDEKAAILLGPIVNKIVELNQAIESRSVEVPPAIAMCLSDAVGMALRSCGIRHFLHLIPLKRVDQPDYIGIDDSREWVLTILHKNLRLMRCRLQDFAELFVPQARICNAAALDPAKHGLNGFQTRRIRSRVAQLWALFPDFCSFGPVDVPTALPGLAKTLEAVLGDVTNPDLLPIVVQGLTNLAEGARERCPLGASFVSPELASLRDLSPTVLPILLMFLESIDVSDHRFQGVVHCLAAFASVSPPALISAIAQKLLQLLLTSTSSLAAPAAKETAAGWMSVMLAIIPFLADQMVVLLYRTVRPLLNVGESISLQKRAYQVLDALLRTHGPLVQSQESAQSILALISDSLLNCHVSARNWRLHCIETLFSTMSDEELHEAAQGILGEVLICQKDANKKTRDGAMSLLKVMVRRVDPVTMLTRLCAAVVAETAVMRSSGVVGICVLLVQQRHDEGLMAQAAELLPTVCLLLREECVEQTRAVLSYLRVCAAALPIEMLGPLLPLTVQAFTTGLGPHKAKFSSRARAILRKLAERVGEEVLQPLVPAADQALLEYIQRQSRRAQRRKEQRVKDNVDKYLGSDSESDDDGDDDEDDAEGDDSMRVGGSGPTDDSRFSSKGRPRAVRAMDVMGAGLPTSLDDLLEDQSASFVGGAGRGLSGKAGMRAVGAAGVVAVGGGGVGGRARGAGTGVVHAHAGKMGGGDAGATKVGGGAASLAGVVARGDDDDEDDEYRVQVNAEGRVIISAKDDISVRAAAADTLLAEAGRRRSREAAAAEKSAASAAAAGGGGAGGGKRQRRDPGEEYRAKNAGGDVWKKGMLEPHAYIPLDPRLLSKKNHREAMGTFGAVVNRKSAEKAKGRQGGNRKQRGNARKSDK